MDNDLLPGEDVSYLFLGKVHPDPGISRRPAVLRRLHAVDARRLRETMSWLVSFSSLRPIGPSRANRDARAGNMGPLHEWLPEALWPKIKALEGLKQFNGLGDAMHSDSDDWLAWFDGATPEVAKFPGDWQKNLGPFDRLILLRALRPDRCSNALASWIGAMVMGKVLQLDGVSLNLNLRECL